MFASHSQIICTIFGIDIYFYGVILALSMMFGVFISEFVARKFYNLNKDIIIELAPYLIIFGIIGARLYYCILNYNFYLRFPTEIFAIRHGGISIHGALIGGLIGLIIFAKKRKISILKLADISSIGLVLAQSFGRWGNFFNYDITSKTIIQQKISAGGTFRHFPSAFAVKLLFLWTHLFR